MTAHTEFDVRIGTCSWKYQSWKGIFYDEGKTYGPNDYLADYARHLDTVEIDQWFWSLFPGGLRLPDPNIAKIYADAVPDDFVFSIKAPNSLTLTHFYTKQPKQHADWAGRPNIHFCDVGLLDKFLELIAPLGGKIGPIMFQYEFLNQLKMGSLEEFLGQLDRFFLRASRQFEYAIEIRNPKYLSHRFFDFLSSHRVGYVYLDGYHMPAIGTVFDRHDPVTSKTVVIRLHGGDRKGIEKNTGLIWNRIVEPQPDGLRAAARIVRSNSAKRIRTFVNVNNHYEGSAPLTIRRFREILEEGGEGD